MPGYIELSFSSRERSRRSSLTDESVLVFVNELTSRCRDYIRSRSTNAMNRFWYSNSNGAARRMRDLVVNFGDGDNVYRLLIDLELQVGVTSDLSDIYEETTAQLFRDSATYSLAGYQAFKDNGGLSGAVARSLRGSGMMA